MQTKFEVHGFNLRHCKVNSAFHPSG